MKKQEIAAVDRRIRRAINLIQAGHATGIANASDAQLDDGTRRIYLDAMLLLESQLLRIAPEADDRELHHD